MQTLRRDSRRSRTDLKVREKSLYKLQLANAPIQLSLFVYLVSVTSTKANANPDKLTIRALKGTVGVECVSKRLSSTEDCILNAFNIFVVSFVNGYSHIVRRTLLDFTSLLHLCFSASEEV